MAKYRVNVERWTATGEAGFVKSLAQSVKRRVNQGKTDRALWELVEAARKLGQIEMTDIAQTGAYGDAADALDSAVATFSNATDLQ